MKESSNIKKLENQIFDVIIIGLGAMGSSIFYQCTKAKLKTLAIEQYKTPHQKGSTHGDTRLTHGIQSKQYYQLIKNSCDVWKELEQKSGQKLFFQSEIYTIAPIQDQTLTQYKQNAQQNSLGYRQVINDPNFRIDSNRFQIYSEDQFSGILYPEEIIITFQQLGLQQNGMIINYTKYLSHKKVQNLIQVVTDKGLFNAKKLVLAQGMHLKQQADNYNKDIIQNYKISSFWLNTAHLKQYDYPNFPGFVYEFGDTGLYGFPNMKGKGIKIGLENSKKEQIYQMYGKNYINRVINDELRVKKLIAQILPDLEGVEINRFVNCYKSETLDQDFIIDYLPDYEGEVILVSCCSGHGFQKSGGIGILIKDMIIGNRKKDSKFKLKRFLKPHL